ncbi:CHASE2 domain-containing protein [Roseibium algae]|uniref:Adenylate/guanylate cyclase domain-containing protein n=1 Tax=Roseibium algae TaxID=3123038 RepID=A0ABU8TKW0_9HYPH
MRRYLPIWVIASVLACGLLWAGWLGQRHLAGTGSMIDRVEMVLLDWRILVTGVRNAPDEVVIVAIDDKTVAAAGAYPIGRNRLALLIEKIRAAGARALAVDILLVSASEPADDASLARALGSIPTVIAAAGQFTDSGLSSLVPVAREQLMPLQELANASSVGLVNVATDAGGTPRHVPLLFKTPDGLEPSFGLRAAGLYLEGIPPVTLDGLRLNGRVQPLDLGWHLPLNYYGPQGTVTTLSAKSLFDGLARVGDLSGRLVVLGVTATGVGDRFGTPFDQVLPGVEIQATGIANLLDGSALIRNRTVRSVDVTAALLITGLGILAVAVLPLANASLAFIGLLVGWLMAITILFGQGYWFSGALPIVASLPPVVALVILRQVLDRYRTRRLVAAREALSRFQAPAIARRIAEDPSFLLSPVEQDVAILFVDLSGYTGLSERLGPAKTRDVLKAFHTLVVNETDRHNGLVLDFMGDGAMLGFGIPDSSARNAADACQCAFDLVQNVGRWIVENGLEAEINTLRVGGHFGPVVLSRLGHDNQQQIAATGDCVNVASRLQEVAKNFHSCVALSGDLTDAAKITEDGGVFAPRMEISAIRGRQKDLQVGLWSERDLAAGL